YSTRFFAPGNQFLAMAFEDQKEVGIWDAKTGKWSRRVSFAWNYWGRGAFSADASRLALSTHYDQLAMFDVASGKKLWQQQPKDKWYFRFNTHSTNLHIVGRYGSYRLDGETGKKLDELPGLVEAGDFLLVHEPAGKDEKIQRVRVLERSSKKTLH